MINLPRSWGAVMKSSKLIAIIVLLASISRVSIAQEVFPDSAEGLQRQITETIQASISGDQVASGVLASLGIPNPDRFFAAHFEPRFATQLPSDYTNSLAKFQSHIAWIAANFGKYSDFGLKAEALDHPAPLAEVGFESLLPKPIEGVTIENYRLTSTSSDPKHGPPSWVSGFTYIDGRFRWIGGTYPFWDESLAALRGPMSLPPAFIHGRTVQGIAFHKDQKGPGLDAVVQFKISIGRDGRVEHIKVLSGDEAFVPDAKEYMKSANFGAMPNIPRLANARREWEFEVAFFTPKK